MADDSVNALNAESSLRTLMQVWCLLVSADAWSRELKDVSNEVVRTITEILLSMISPSDIVGSAARLARTTIHLMTMVVIDSNKQHVLPTVVRLISAVVRILLGLKDSDVHTQIKLSEVSYVLIKVCENFVNR